MSVFNSLNELMGKTPLLKISNYMKANDCKANILAKLEYFNPAGSVKDRVAINIIETAEKDGLLTSNSTVIEPTSGNTGIGIAAVCAAKGYKAVIVMPENMSVERQKLIKAYGADLVLTDASLGMKGAIEKAQELNIAIPDSIIAGQFVNPANWVAHFETTAPEIYNDTNGNVDIFVCGVGTGGTITGIGKYLKSKNSNVKIVAVEPEDSPYLSKSVAGSHKIQGIGAGFIPEILDTEIYDEIITVNTKNAYESARMLAKIEGVLVGISSGAALWAATELAKMPANANKNIIVLLPDGGERYLSTDLYEL